MLVATFAHGQDARIEHGAAANQEYAAVFAHSGSPCSADYRTEPYLQCMSNELQFVEAHLDAFVADLRGVTESTKELAALNKADAAWRVYRETFCRLPYARFRGTVNGPMAADCRLRVDREFMEQLHGMYLLSQFPK
ncbi:MAG: lysozyme inhibitor LprI family protein [Acidobacteriaceae bacterium]